MSIVTRRSSFLQFHDKTVLQGDLKNADSSDLRVPMEEPLKDFNWPLQEEEFVVTLQEDGWNLGSVQSYNQQQDSICVQALTTLKTGAKDDQGKTY